MTSRPPPTPSSPHTPTTPSSTFSNSSTLLPSSSLSEPTNPQTLQFRRKITHLSTPLAPLLSITSGTIHRSFPPTILHYHLLTSAQLEDLAHHYHQRTPSAASLFYPNPVVGRWNVSSSTSRGGTAGNVGGNRGRDVRVLGQMEGGGGNRLAGLEERRRRFGRFMGLRGCESPNDNGGGGNGAHEREQRAMEMWVAEEMRRRREREERELMGRGKGCW
ncbi:MAG: hypothetical protein L6R42_002353 [Xanthoria sp. 1 TBL-2021]|nr:MAG: hypothetical protein L6R42_002353 [Xanthoria sp. 1 TBL-2021]